MNYEYYDNILCVPAKLLYGELALICEDKYKYWKKMKYVSTVRQGKGKGNYALISFYDIAKQWVKDAIIEALGPPEDIVQNELEQYIKKDFKAYTFFSNYRKPCGTELSRERQLEYATNAGIFNAITEFLFVKRGVIKGYGGKKIKTSQVWKNIQEAIDHLESVTHEGTTRRVYKFNLPKNQRSLKRKYDKYIEEGYMGLLDGNIGRKNRLKISKDAGDFLLSKYCLPNKFTIPEVLEFYDLERAKNGKWKELTHSAVYQFLYKPENRRIWTLARHGEDEYKKEYKRTHTIDKEKWFPNCYWAIDGTKLDWIHQWEDSSNKLGAKLKIDVMFDVYSEKIIGYDLSFTESHIEHFNTIKMAVNESQCRPYFLTYDNQSGHKMERMQNLYSSLVAKDGGRHYPGAAKEHGNPAEGLFKRFQQQVLNKFWFSDGQSITVRRADNKMNIDFIKKNKGRIKTVEELHKVLEAAVNMWNNRPKNKTKGCESRNELYAEAMPMREELSLFDIMDKMWIEQKKREVKYRREGLRFRLGEDVREYEVLDADGNIDIEFRRKHVGDKFIVRYDPSFLDGYIQLCKKDANGDVYQVANAQPKRKMQPVPALMDERDKEQWKRDHQVYKIEKERDWKAYKDLMNRTGVTPEKMMEEQDLLVKFKGNLSKTQRAQIESQENLTSATSRL